MKTTTYYIPSSSRIRVAWKCPHCGLTDYKEIFAYNKEFKHICVGKCKKEYIVKCGYDDLKKINVTIKELEEL